MSHAGYATRSAASRLPIVMAAPRAEEEADGAKKEASGKKGFRDAATEGDAREGECRRLSSRLISRKR
jgi:hypothetical protein